MTWLFTTRKGYLFMTVELMLARDYGHGSGL